MSSQLPLIAPPDVPMQDRGRPWRVGTVLYLVRHAESMTNVYANLSAYDPNLTARGWAQALRVGDWMAQKARLDVVVTSPLRRAHSTALAIALAQDLEPVSWPGLEEFSVGFFDELPHGHPTQPWLMWEGWNPSDGEASGFISFRDRVLQALNEILQAYAGQRIAIVSHGGTMNVLVGAMLGLPLANMVTYNTGVSLFEWAEWRRWLVFYINAREHLLDLDPEDYPRLPEAEQDEEGRWRLPEGLVERWTALPMDPRLAFLANKARRADSLLFIEPPDPITPLRVSLRARRAVVMSRDLQALEAGEVRRALLNANHVRYQYLFRPLPYPDDAFDLVITPNDPPCDPAEIERVLKRPSGLIQW
ncbi:MAG: histidine phosphatase family protein [Chloroflexi bacterium]|nr:histidine phosphatase family protein [Chloroflexota bacterium]